MLVDFHSLFQHYSKDVFRFALYLSGDPSLAEEIAQETFVRAWVMAGEIREGTVKGYLLTIARNLFLAEGKRLARQVALEGAVPDTQPGPEVVVSGRLELAAVLEALQTLPETDRAALLLHAQDGLSHAAIASMLGLSTTAVKVRVHRARIKLRQLCDPKGD
jgi:RNA polymerase sigma-70 factor (ECF subfamily)